MKKIVKILFLLFFISISQNIFSQKIWGLYSFAGYKYRGLSFGEIGVNWSRVWGPTLPFPAYSFGLGSEISYLDNEMLWGPKVVAEGNLVVFAGRMNGTFYVNSKKSEFILTTEIGLTLFNIVNLYYGYNFRFREKVFDRISTHRFTFTVNVFLGIYHKTEDYEKWN